LSDASVPGEGEHKIIDFIRRQQKSPNYNPNISHCIAGPDADLIMLGLATHETNFVILRQEFDMSRPMPCEICSRYGHKAKDCSGFSIRYVFVNIIV
jgi:5'-3' exoribonuclease 2